MSQPTVSVILYIYHQQTHRDINDEGRKYPCLDLMEINRGSRWKISVSLSEGRSLYLIFYDFLLSGLFSSNTVTILLLLRFSIRHNLITSFRL